MVQGLVSGNTYAATRSVKHKCRKLSSSMWYDIMHHPNKVSPKIKYKLIAIHALYAENSKCSTDLSLIH